MANLSKANDSNLTNVISSPTKCKSTIKKNTAVSVEKEDDVPPIEALQTEIRTPSNKDNYTLNVSCLQKDSDSVPLDSRPLSDFAIDIDAIEPANLPPRILKDDPQGLKIMLHFTSNRPREDIFVMVISTMNQSVKPITEYTFDASVSKVC